MFGFVLAFAPLLASAHVAVRVLIIGLLITAIVTLVVFFVAREVKPTWAGAAALIVLLVGALLTLADAL